MTTIATRYPFVGNIETRQGGRSENQDNAGFIDTPLGLLLVVCDGMGGGPGGRTASYMAIKAMLNRLSDVAEHTAREDALRYAIEKANETIYAKAKDTPELRGMGTTVAAILINEDSAVIAHAGDTRIYQLRKGTIVFRSADHSVVANLVRQHQLTEEQARNHPQSNMVTRALGVRPNVEIEFDEVTFERGDRFVLCTDGIWGMMPQRDLVKSLSRVMGIDELTISIAEEIDRMGHNNGGNHDNLTLAVLDTTFDSALRRIKKKVNNETAFNDGHDSIKSQRKSGYILVAIFIVMVLLIVAFLLWDNVSKNPVSSEPVAPQQRGETVSTITSPNIVNDAINEEAVINDTVISDGRTDEDKKPTAGVSPFDSSPITDGLEQEIANNINQVTENLDSLKKINKSVPKREFVNKNIIPGIKQLERTADDRKKKHIKDILRLLNKKKTVATDNQGRSTLESVKYIDSIKAKVTLLKN